MTQCIQTFFTGWAGIKLYILLVCLQFKFFNFCVCFYFFLSCFFLSWISLFFETLNNPFCLFEFPFKIYNIFIICSSDIIYTLIIIKLTDSINFFSGREHLKLIFDFSVWVLKAHPDDGLKVNIFQDYNNVINIESPLCHQYFLILALTFYCHTASLAHTSRGALQ